MSEPLSRLLAELPAAKPDEARAERIRISCRAQLVRNTSRASPARTSAPRNAAMQVWRPLVALLGIAYMTEVIVQALRLYGI